EAAVAVRRPVEDRALDEVEVGTDVVEAGVLDAARVELDADHLGGPRGEQRGAVPFAAADVDDPAPARHRGGEVVAPEVLVHHLHVVGPGDAPLPGPFDEAGRRGAHGYTPARVRPGRASEAP